DGQDRPADAGRNRDGGCDQQDPERAAAHLGILGDPARQTRRNAAARRRGRHGTQSVNAAPSAARDNRQGADEQEEDTMNRISIAVGALALLTLPAAAEDSFKVAIGQINNWENQAPTLGQDVGIFKKHGIVLDNFGTAGAGETMQPTLSASADIGAGVGVAVVMRAFSKGAPVRIIAPAFTGTGDLYWYVKGDSPIKSLKDLAAQNTIAYSTSGSSSNNIVVAFVNELGAKAKPTATGSPPGTLTAVMSGQIDVGWAAPPFGLREIQEGKIRIIARGSDVPSLRGQTVRVLIANANMLAQRKEAVARFMAAYREAVDWMYANPEAVAMFSKKTGVAEELVHKSMQEFQPKDALQTDQMADLDGPVKAAVKFKFLDAPLTKEQLAELIQSPPRAK